MAAIKGRSLVNHVLGLSALEDEEDEAARVCAQPRKARRRAAAARDISSFPAAAPAPARQTNERRETEYLNNFSRLPFYFKDKHAAPLTVHARTHGRVLLRTGGSGKTVYLCTTAGGRVHISETK